MDRTRLGFGSWKSLPFWFHQHGCSFLDHPWRDLCSVGQWPSWSKRCGRSIAQRIWVALQRVYSYYVPTSYAPLLSHFHHVLFEDASWGFNVEEDEDGEIHVDRTLNVVGSGAQHTSLFKDPSKPGFRGTMSSGDGWKMLEYSVPCRPCLDWFTC